MPSLSTSSRSHCAGCSEIEWRGEDVKKRQGRNSCKPSFLLFVKSLQSLDSFLSSSNCCKAEAVSPFLSFVSSQCHHFASWVGVQRLRWSFSKIKTFSQVTRLQGYNYKVTKFWNPPHITYISAPVWVCNCHYWCWDEKQHWKSSLWKSLSYLPQMVIC